MPQCEVTPAGFANCWLSECMMKMLSKLYVVSPLWWELFNACLYTMHSLFVLTAYWYFLAFFCKAVFKQYNQASFHFSTLSHTIKWYYSSIISFFCFILLTHSADHIGRSPGLLNPVMIFSAGGAKGISNTVQSQPTLPDCSLCINTEPTTSIGRLIKFKG